MNFKIINLTWIIILGLTASVFGGDDWNEYKGQHFIIYYKDAPENFVKSVESMAENYYREISENLGFTRYKNWSWEDRAKIYIYKDDEDYMNTSRQMRWSHGAASAKEKIIRTFPAAHGFFDSTLPHELGHIIFREFVGYKSFDIPTWVEEGVAMNQEKAQRFGADKIVKEAIADRTFMTLDELSKLRLDRDTDKEMVDLFYAESASVINYMINELGEYKFVGLCRELKEGNRFVEALHNTYLRFRDIEDLNKAWLDYLLTIVP